MKNKVKFKLICHSKFIIQNLAKTLKSVNHISKHAHFLSKTLSHRTRYNAIIQKINLFDHEKPITN